eukprot:4348390-Heterocapsa_arctica.AAC.1
MYGSSASCWFTSGVVRTPTRNRTTRPRRYASAAQQHSHAIALEVDAARLRWQHQSMSAHARAKPLCAGMATERV